MRHSFAIKKLKGGARRIDLSITYTEEEQKAVFDGTNDPYITGIKSLETGYKEKGISWLLHLLRLYDYFVVYGDAMAKQQALAPKLKEPKKKTKKKRIIKRRKT